MAGYKKKTCEMCGQEFITCGTYAFYCPDCRKTAYNRYERNSYAREQKQKPKKKTGTKLNETIAKANAMGLSYGKYKAQLYLKEHKM